MFKITLPPSSRVQGVKYFAAASLDIISDKKYRAYNYFWVTFLLNILMKEPL